MTQSYELHLGANMGVFQSFGDEFSATVSGFAESTSSALIDNLLLPISLGLTIYFVCKGYLIMAGRIQDSVTDLCLTCGKIALIAVFALNAGNFVSYVLPAIRGLESMLISAVESATGSADSTSAWGTIDSLWLCFMDALNATWGLMGKFGIRDIAEILALLLISGVLGIVSVFFTFSAVGVLLINEVCLTVTLGFGPLFLCCLMFPVLRSWFDGWIKASITYVFTIVIAAAVMMLFGSVFDDVLLEICNLAESPNISDSLLLLFLPILKFVVLSLTAATMIRLVPSVAAGMTGGVAMQAVGVGQMVGGLGQGLQTMTGAGLLGAGIAMGNANLQKKGDELMGGQRLSQNGNFVHAGAGYVAGGFARAAQAGTQMAQQVWRSATSMENINAQAGSNIHFDQGPDLGSIQRYTTGGFVQPSPRSAMGSPVDSMNSQALNTIAQSIPDKYKPDPNFICPAQYANWSVNDFHNAAAKDNSLMGNSDFSKAYEEATKAQWRRDHIY